MLTDGFLGLLETHPKADTNHIRFIKITGLGWLDRGRRCLFQTFQYAAYRGGLFGSEAAGLAVALQIMGLREIDIERHEFAALTDGGEVLERRRQIVGQRLDEARFLPRKRRPGD